jgi:oligoendopeptidase F
MVPRPISDRRKTEKSMMSVCRPLSLLAGILWLSIPLSSPALADFQPIPEQVEELYHFRLEENFYPDEAAFEADLDELVHGIEELETLKGQVVASADNLYHAYDMINRLTPLWDKLWVYAYLRYAINTLDAEPFRRVQTLSGDLSGRIQFIRSEVQRMDDEVYARYRAERADLAKYAFAIEQDRRYRPHTLPLLQEEILSQLDPFLDPWVEELYQRCVDRTEFPDLVPAPGETLDVNIHYNRLINDTSRVIRRKTWQGYFHSMHTHRDLYAFALIEKAKTKGRLARLRHFDNYPQLSYFDQLLTPQQVEGISAQIAARAGLYKEFQLLRQKAIRAAAGYDTVYTWDRSVPPRGFEKPRWDIVRAGDLIIEALAPLGDEYGRELAGLFDPVNGRLDLVAGENRFAGAFAYGYPGAPWSFYSFSYEGYLSDVSTLAHEAGHAVHYTMLANAGVEPIYHQGPYYVTETVAMLNELLLVDHLYKRANDVEERTYLMEAFLRKAVHFIYINFLASLEAAIYHGVADGELTTADDLDALTREMGAEYNVYYQLHPEYAGVWNVFHHYYTHPMYNLNYVIAGALSLRIFQAMQDDPSFVDRYLQLVRHGLDRPAPEMIRETLGLDIGDADFLTPAFQLLENTLADLEDLYRGGGIPLD